METDLLIDCDTIVFKAALTKTAEGGARSFDEAVRGIESHLDWLKRRLKADKATMILSDPSNNFRQEIFPTYKSHRIQGERPPIIDKLKDYFREEHGAFHWFALEADDVQGILATSPSDTRKIVVSIDKDLRQIPGELFNPDKKDQGIQLITPEKGMLWMWTQTLIGDPVDGYSGVPLVGPDMADLILSKALLSTPVEQLWPVVLEVFKRYSLPEYYALLQLRCARILQATEWDAEFGLPMLYFPPGVSSASKKCG